MGVLEGLSQFAGGVSRGAPQGLDLYQQYQTVQDENQKRQKKQAFEAKVSELAQSGGFDDPVKGVRTAADYARELGDIDTYLTYNDHANKLQKTAADREGMMLFQTASAGDFAGAAQHLNSMNQILGTGAQYDIQKTPKGWAAITNLNGKKSEVPLETDKDVQGFFFATAKPYLFDDVGEYMEAEREDKKAASQAALQGGQLQLAQAQSATEEARRQGEVGLLGAQTEAAGASATANRAQAGYYSAQAAAEPGKAALEGQRAQAEIAYKRALTANVGQPVDPTISATVAKLYPSDELGLGEGPDRGAIASVASGIKNVNGVDPETAVTTAGALLTTPGVALNPKTNTAYLPDGTPLQMDASAMASLFTARQAEVVK